MDPPTPNADGPNDAQTRLDRAYAWEEAGEFEQALAECEAALRLQPALAEAHNLRGILLEELNRPQEAIEAYRRALKHDPDFQEAQDNLSELQSALAAPHQLVTVARFSHVAEAHVVKARLQALGMPAFVADEGIVTMNWLWSNAVGGVRVQVRRADAARAEQILAQRPYEPSLKRDNPRCPRCGSFDARFQRLSLRRAFVVMFLLSIPNCASISILIGIRVPVYPQPFMNCGTDCIVAFLAAINLLLLFFFVQKFLSDKSWTCQECSHRWKPDSQA